MDDTYSKYISGLKPYQQHSEFETRGLISKLKKDKNTIIKGNMRLVAKVALDMSQAWPQFDVMDFVQEGNEILINIVDKFDPEKRVRWSTFLAYCVRMKILQYIQRNTGVVRIDRTLKQRQVFGKLSSIREELEAGGALDEVAARFDTDPPTILNALNANNTDNVDKLVIPSPEDAIVEQEYMDAVHKKINGFRKTLNTVELVVFNENIYRQNKTLEELALFYDRSSRSLWNTKANILRKASVFFSIDDLTSLEEGDV